MREMANYGDKRMTVKEVAEALGYEPQALKYHIRELYPDLMQNGVATYLTEEQVTTLKQKLPPVKVLTGAMTDLEAGMMAAKVIGHYQARYEQERHKALEQEERAIRAERELMATESLLTERETGLSTYQRIAESRGLVLSDRDDLTSAYRRGA